MKSRMVGACTLAGALLATAPLLANVTGAIWTSLSDGSEVDTNLYDAKEDVYLNGGPGKGAGSNSPGLGPDGVYIFMVTAPNGDLLSTDAAQCREVQVTGGLIVGATGPCPHANGSPQPGGATAVQLIPYSDTPNPGGEYKAWLTPLNKYVCPLDQVTCDDGQNGFINAESKTDNFKVDSTVPDEIDTRFWDGQKYLDGMGVKWIDTFGASNQKFSYYAPSNLVFHEAHVESPEIGTHYIVIGNQPGCTVGEVYVAGSKQRKNGPQTVAVRVTKAMKKSSFTIFVDVACY